MAATLAATVAIGVGVALARAERDRRSIRAGRARERQFALWPSERLTDGLRRMALGQLDIAIELLGDDGGALRAAAAVHETRKSLKRVRALIALVRYELGEAEFTREDAILREAGRRLAGARDAEVLVSTLDQLARDNPKKLARRRGVAKLRRQLVAERDRALERARDDAWARAQLVRELRALRARVQAWSLPDREGIESVKDGLRGIYGQGRRRRRRAARGKGGSGRAMHRWRKRVKDLQYAAAMLDRRDPRSPKQGSGDSRRARRHGHGQERADAERIRRLGRRADELGDLLGEEHDLALLAARLSAKGARAEDGRLKAGAGTRKILLKLIARRRRRLRRRALRKGKRLYRRAPNGFVRRVGDAYARRNPG